MLRIDWHGLQVSQIVCICWYHSHAPQHCPQLIGSSLLLMRTTGLVYAGKGHQQNKSMQGAREVCVLRALVYFSMNSIDTIIALIYCIF